MLYCSIVLMLHRKKPENMFSRGKRGYCPPILARLFSTDPKRGRGFDPPKIFGPAMEIYRQRAAKHRKTPQNTAKHRKAPQNPTKCHKMPNRRKCTRCCRLFAEKRRKTLEKTRKRRKTPENARKCRKTPENAGKHRKTPENARKRRKYCELSIRLRGTKYLGGGQKPMPPFQVC